MCKEFGTLPSNGGVKDQDPKDIEKLLKIMEAKAAYNEFLEERERRQRGSIR